jgi:twinkle protein
MSNITHDEPCPACQETNHDSSGNHLICFEDGGKYCGKSQYHKSGEPYVVKGGDTGDDRCEGKSKTTSTSNSIRQTTPNLSRVSGLPVTAIPTRGLTEETCKHFGVRCSLSETDRSIEKIYYPRTKAGKLVDYKFKDLTIPKKEPFHFGTLARKGEVTLVDLFGESVCTTSNKKLIVTEGENDALAAFQMLYDYSKIKFPDGRYPPNVVSLPSGASMDKNGKGVVNKDVLARKDFFMQFDEVILCLDQDAAGQAVTATFTDWLGSDKVKCMKFSEKDANDILLAKKHKEFINALFHAKIYKPQSLITVADVFEEATKMPEWGKGCPWPSLTAITYGRRGGDGYMIGAGVKVGKSEWLNQFVAYIVENEPGNRPLIIKGEEIPGLTAKKVAGKIFHKNFHDPTGDFTQEELTESMESIKDSFFMYQGKNGLDWEDCKSVIRSAVMEGCKDVFIDPLTCFVDGTDPSKADTFLKGMVRDIDNMAKDLDFTYYIFCHLNNPPQGGKPHEEGGRVRSNQFTGSKIMIRAGSYIIGLERNKQAEDIIERNTTLLRVIDDRIFGKYTEFPIFYDTKTGDYLEPAKAKEDDGLC